MYCFLIFHRVSPHQVTEDAIKWNFLSPIDLVNLIEHFEARRDTTVHGEVLFADVAGNWHCIKDFHKEIVYLNVKALQDFIPEGERFSHIARLVISTEKDDVSWEVELDCEQKDAYLNTLDTAINIVTEE